MQRAPQTRALQVTHFSSSRAPRTRERPHAQSIFKRKPNPDSPKVFPKLSEVRRTNPGVERAASSVEGIFGRPLKNDPETRALPKKLVFDGVTADGKFLSCGAATNLVHEIVHLEDLHAIGRTKYQYKGLREAMIRLQDHPILETIRRIFGKGPKVDSSNIPSPNLVTRTALEGRAKFASQLAKGKVKRFFNGDFAMFALGAACAVMSCFGEPRSGHQAFLDFLKPFDTAFLAVASSWGFVYWAFHNSLCRIAKKVGDPIKAFRITSEKFPTKMRHILFPLKYYSEEIKEANSPNQE